VVRQTGNAAGLVAGLVTGDYELIGRSLHDVIAEPVRAQMIEGFTSMKRGAIEAGALGCSISGSGPALFALARDRASAEMAARAMGDVLNGLERPYDLYVSCINPRGATVLQTKPHDAL
jgi:homoserine kinase